MGRLWELPPEPAQFWLEPEPPWEQPGASPVLVGAGDIPNKTFIIILYNKSHYFSDYSFLTIEKKKIKILSYFLNFFLANRQIKFEKLNKDYYAKNVRGPSFTVVNHSKSPKQSDCMVRASIHSVDSNGKGIFI